MRTHTARTIILLAALALAPGIPGVLTAASASPPEDRILPADQYTSEKARRLAATHARALRDLNESIYHCLPWLEVHRQSIGFFRPKGAAGDDRYLALRVYIEQDASPQFARLSLEERASAMFSRYVAPLLRRMAADQALVNDPALDGFTVILEWLKQAAQNGDRPVHETIAVFVPKPLAMEFLSGRAAVAQLAQRARVMAWDGESALGQLTLTAWDDAFVSTYRVANYQLAAGVSCPR